MDIQAILAIRYPNSKKFEISKYPIIQVSKKNWYPRYPNIRISKKSGIRPSLDAMQSVEMLCKLEKNLLADINPFWEFFLKRSVAEAEPYVARIDMDLYSAVVRC